MRVALELLVKAAKDYRNDCRSDNYAKLGRAINMAERVLKPEKPAKMNLPSIKKK